MSHLITGQKKTHMVDRLKLGRISINADDGILTVCRGAESPLAIVVATIVSLIGLSLSLCAAGIAIFISSGIILSGMNCAAAICLGVVVLLLAGLAVSGMMLSNRVFSSCMPYFSRLDTDKRTLTVRNFLRRVSVGQLPEDTVLEIARSACNMDWGMRVYVGGKSEKRRWLFMPSAIIGSRLEVKRQAQSVAKFLEKNSSTPFPVDVSGCDCEDSEHSIQWI